MSGKKPKKRPPSKPRGPEPENLTIDGDWEEAVAKAVKRPAPSPAQSRPVKKRRKPE